MNQGQLPAYAVFDDYRYSQRIAVLVRWFVVLGWLALINYRVSLTTTLLALNLMGAGLLIVNGYTQWRISRDRPITRRWVLALSAMDLAVITAGIGITTRFHNTFFVFYYPALLGFSLVFSSRRLSFATVTLVAGAYIGLSLSLEPALSYFQKEEKVLAARVLSMFAVVAAANLMARIERTRRREAVEAERAQAQRNLELQKRAQEAELAALEARSRIAREIHDGIAQSIYMLSLNLETCADLAEREPGPLRERLRTLVPLAKQTLLETRHYIFDLKPLLSGEEGLVTVAENQVKEFRTVAAIPAALSVQGRPRQVPPAVAAALYRILQEALANILKHAQASQVSVAISFEVASVRLTVQDDGTGFHPEQAGPGYGLENMRQRAQELGGSCELVSAPGKGACVRVTLPA